MPTDVQLMDGEFRFLVPLAKATGDGDNLFVEGIASDTGMDLQEQRIGLKGQQSMAWWAKAGKVALGGEADHFQIAFDDDLGKLVDGSVSDQGEFFIKAQLDTDNPRAVGLHTSLGKGKQLGLSVFGKVTEFHDEAGVPVIDGVQLTRVMVTPSPANPRTWLADIAKSLPSGQVTPQQDGEDTGGTVTAEVAKGMFLDALRAEMERDAELAPLMAQFERVSELDGLLHLLFEVAYSVSDQVGYNDFPPDQAAALLSEAIEEFKLEAVAKAQAVGNAAPAEIVAKDGEAPVPEAPEDPANDEAAPIEAPVAEAPVSTEETPAEGEEIPTEEVAPAEGEGETAQDGQAPESAPDEEPPVENEESHAESAQAPAPDTTTGGGVMPQGKSLSEIAHVFADDRTAEVQAQIAPQLAPQPSHPAVMVADTFTEAVKRLVADGQLSQDEKRQAVALALAATMQHMEEVLPAAPADDGLEEAPAWARALVTKVNDLETALQKQTTLQQQHSVNVSAGSVALGTPPENTDNPTLPTRKSQVPDLQPSTVVQRTQTLRDIALQLVTGSTNALRLP